MSSKQEIETAAFTGIEKQLVELEASTRQFSPEALALLPNYVQAVRLARGMEMIRNTLTERVITEVFMPLQGTRLGFRTDKDSRGGYDWKTVRDVLVEAMMRDFRPVNNEFNIIGGNFYGAQNGFERKVRTFPGLQNLELHPGVPNQKEGGGNAAVPYRITYLLDGKPCEYLREALKDEKGVIVRDGRIPVKVNEGMGPDAILGKAKRKVLASLYEKISGITVPDGDIIDTLGAEVTEKSAVAATEEMLRKHAERNAPKLGNGNGPKPAAPTVTVSADGEIVEGSP